MQIYLVGGALRNELLNLPVADHDWVVVGATPQQMLAQNFQQVGASFPVFLHPETKEEYALARTERKVAAGYTGFEFNSSSDVTLEQDLLRRDLTINAIARDQQGNLIDPYSGVKDLKQRILRHISPAFAEDPVRVLRVARLAAQLGEFNFSVADETMALMTEMVRNGEVNALVAERVWKETEKALASKFPSRYLELLRECGALKILFPEIDALFGVPQHPHHHPEVDTGVHTLLVLQEAVKLSDDLIVRFAALVHDLGKALTPKSEWPKHQGHEAAGVEPIKQLCQRFKIPNKFVDFAIAVAKYHLYYHRAGEMDAPALLELMQNLDGFRRPERWQQFVLACEADSRGRPGYQDQQPQQTKILNTCFAAASAVDIKAALATQNLRGKAIKAYIDSLREAAIQHSINDIM